MTERDAPINSSGDDHILPGLATVKEQTSAGASLLDTAPKTTA